MLAKKLIPGAGVGGEETDQYFNQTTLLLKGDVVDPDVSYNAFSDASSNTFPIVPYGNPYGNAFSPYNSTFSNYFDGSGDYLGVASNAAFGIGTGDFTLEAWVYPTAYGTTRPVYTTGATGGLWFGSLDGTSFSVHTSNSSTLLTYAGVPTLNTWTHVVAVRSGTTLSIFFNGTRVATTTNSTNLAQGAIAVGSDVPNGGISYWLGNISNTRLVKGSAVYDPTQTTITVPTAPLTAISGTSLLTCQSNRFIDNSANNFTITVNGDTKVSGFIPFTDTDTTTGSGYFDGSGDYLTLASTSSLSFGTGDFCVETWVYPTTSNVAGLIGNGVDSGDGDAQWELQIGTSLVPKFIGWNTVFLTSSVSIASGSWYHISVCRSGTNCSMFINGTRVANATVSQDFSSTKAVNIGRQATGSAPLYGYMSNTRVVKGSAVYDPSASSITVPTSLLIAVSNTQLLTLQNRGASQNFGFLDTTKQNLITANGNATQGTFSPFSQTGWSNYFDGTGDYLSMAPGAIGTGDFTLECWVYFNSLGTNQGVLDTRSDSNTNGFALLGRSTGEVSMADGTSLIGTATSVSANTWIHIAASRASGVLSFYVNGTRSGGTLSNTTNFSNNRLRVGAIGSAGENLGGYVSNARLLNTAIYSGTTITVPSAPFSDDANTTALLCQSNRFIDNATPASTITVTGNTSVQAFSPFAPTAAYSAATNGGSGYFDGSGDYLTVPSSTSFSPGSGDWTFEGWFYRKAATANVRLVNFSDDNGNLTFNRDGVANLGAYINSSDYSFGTTPVNSWVHFAISVTSGTCSGYLNGTRVFNFSGGSTSTSARSFSIAANPSGNDPFDGWISNLNFVNGTGKYSGTSISVPTSPFTQSSGTSLLLNFTNAGIIDSTGRNNLETVGNAEITTAVEKYGTGSLYFDGSGDYLVIKDNPGFDLGSGNFTVEAWINMADVTPPKAEWIVSQWLSDTNNGWGLRVETDGTLAFYYATTATNAFALNVSSPGLVSNTWHHVAAVRNGSTLTLYVDGTSVGSTSFTVTIYNSSADVMVGNQANTGNGQTFTGYIDDLRITKGVARYTTTFTPPAKSLPKL